MGEASPDLMGAEISVRASVGGIERHPMRVGVRNGEGGGEIRDFEVAGMQVVLGARVVVGSEGRVVGYERADRLG